MDWSSALFLLLGTLLLLMLTGLPVAFAFLGVNLIGAFVFLGGEIGLDQVVRNTIASVSNFSLAPIPLFLLMGEILFQTGVAFAAINAIDKLITRVPGRLSIVSVLGGTMFSSLSGSTIANTAVLGSALLPDMLKRGYHPTIAMGPIMATGSIAMLIPPSALAVLLGSLAGISIAKLLIAGIIPGLMMAASFLIYIIVRCRANPALAPAYDVEPATLWQRWKPLLTHVLPLMGIFVVVVGSILGGWATPTRVSCPWQRGLGACGHRLWQVDACGDEKGHCRDRQDFRDDPVHHCGFGHIFADTCLFRRRGRPVESYHRS